MSPEKKGPRQEEKANNDILDVYLPTQQNEEEFNPKVVGKKLAEDSIKFLEKALENSGNN